MVTEVTGGNHLVDQHGLHCAWWTGAKNSMIWIQQRQKKTNKCKSQLQFFRCFMPSHGGFTLWLIFSGGLSLSSSYSSAGLIVDSQVNVFYNADSLSLSLIDPSSTGKGEGWTSPNYRNTGGRGPPPGGGPRRFISPSDNLHAFLNHAWKL